MTHQAPQSSMGPVSHSGVEWRQVPCGQCQALVPQVFSLPCLAKVGCHFPAKKSVSPCAYFRM